MRERLIILALRIDNSYGKEIGNSGRKATADSFREGVLSNYCPCPDPDRGSIVGKHHSRVLSYKESDSRRAIQVDRQAKLYTLASKLEPAKTHYSVSSRATETVKLIS
jgi:hypothetical protein